MNRYYRIGIIILMSVCAIGGIITYGILFYPQQIMPIGEPVEVTTIDTAKYHNDCLHPCIRYSKTTGKYYMAQSPYYGWNNKVENPMFYVSDNYMRWDTCLLIADTPEKGFNSDPNICLCADGAVLYIWREVCTPLCDSLECLSTTVGGVLNLDGRLEAKSVYCVNTWHDGDIEQAPVIIEREGMRYIYATWYQYEPKRKNMGIAIWQEDIIAVRSGGISRFLLVDTIPFESIYTVDKCAQARAFGHIFYIPKPQHHDLWHFDLFEYAGKLYMVSVAEKGDNIMLSVSNDGVHFKTYRKPLVNNHYTENYCGYRQYYYKPTAFVKDDTFHLFYTANAKDDCNRNQLFHTEMQIKQLLK